MSTEVSIGSRKFYIVSAPDQEKGWIAQVLEVLGDGKGTEDVGIETTGETRTMADERALGVLQNRLRAEIP
jgi:hypothetical protein